MMVNDIAGCQAPVASASTKELRLKGSSFLRRHASRHGIANASRKLTAQVIRELSQHYFTAHKVVVAEDDLQVSINLYVSGHTRWYNKISKKPGMHVNQS